MFNITNYKEKTNRNYSEASLSQRKEIRGVGKKKYEKREFPYSVGRKLHCMEYSVGIPQKIQNKNTI